MKKAETHPVNAPVVTISGKRKLTVMRDNISDEQWGKISAAVAEKAAAGNMQAAQILFTRLGSKLGYDDDPCTDADPGGELAKAQHHREQVESAIAAGEGRPSGLLAMVMADVELSRCRTDDQAEAGSVSAPALPA